MRYEEYRKAQIRHLRCVVCGHIYASQYDEGICAFPIYHPILKQQKEVDSCEHHFYKTLLRIYQFIHRYSASVPISRVMGDFNWQERVLMKKEMLSWCLSRGFLGIDSLSRIMIPPPLYETCQDLFTKTNLEKEELFQEAVAMLQGAIKVLKNRFEPVPFEHMPFKPGEINDPNADYGPDTQEDNTAKHSRMVVVEQRNLGTPPTKRIRSG